MKAMTPLAQRLVLSRIDLDISQGDLAQRAGISQSFLSRIERGRVIDVSVATLKALAQALGVRPEYLAGWSDDPLGEDRPASLAEGRVVYQVESPGQYRVVQDLLEVFGELSPENQRLLLQLAEQLRKVNDVRIIGAAAAGSTADAGR